MSNQAKRKCCTAPPKYHPNSCLCKRFGEVKQCPPGVRPEVTIVTESGAGGPGPKEMPAPDWLTIIVEAVDAAGDNVPPRLLTSLADGLADIGCAKQALEISQLARDTSSTMDFNLVARTFRIDADAHRLLGDPNAAIKAFDIAAHLSAVARLRLDLDT